jgi:tRNA (cmo5U34)-methyltransferase
MLQMSRQLIAEAIGESGEILVLGAGGGLETEAFAARAPAWRFCAIDPDAAMIEAARDRVRACGAMDRVTWVEGFVFDAPPDQCDAAVCLLTLHFVADNGEKLRTLEAVRARLRPHAPFILVDLCMDKNGSDHQLRLARYQRFANESGAPAEQAEATTERVRDVINTVSADRNELLLKQAGFKDIDLFYVGLSWRGWVAYA